MKELSRLLKYGADALVGGKAFSEVFPRIASIARNDLLVDSVVKLHLAVTARDEVIERLSSGGRSSLIGLIDYADSVRRQPLVALLELLSELGINLNKAVEWQSFSEEYGKLGIEPSELKALARALRALYEDGFINIEAVEKVAKDLAIKASAAKPNSEVFREFHRDLWRLVLMSARNARDEFISVDLIGNNRLGNLLSRYMPPRLVIDILSQVRHYAVSEAEALLRNLANSLGKKVDELRSKLKDMEARLSDLIGNGSLSEAERLSKEVGELRRALTLYENALNTVSNALNALSYGENIDLRIQLLRSSVKSLRDSLSKIAGELRDAELGIKAANLIEAIVITEALINGLGGRYVNQPNK